MRPAAFCSRTRISRTRVDRREVFRPGVTTDQKLPQELSKDLIFNSPSAAP